jgi:drug/metabolite transporter (DMT)-like permease
MSDGQTPRASLAFIALLAGAVAISFAPILVRLADVSPVASAFWRVALAAPVLWLWMLMTPRRVQQVAADSQEQMQTHMQARMRKYAPAVFAGIFFACDLGVWHVAITWTSVANAALEANFAPVFVTLGAWLLWRQRPTGLFLLALVLTLGGAVLLIGPNVHASGPAFKGDLLGVLTAVFYAGYMLSIKLAAQLGTARLMTISTSITALALLPFALVDSERFLPQSAQGWAVLAGMALIAQVAGQSLIAYAFARLPAAMSSVSLVLQPVLAAVFAWILLGESMTPLQMAGGVVVLIGIVLAKRYG